MKKGSVRRRIVFLYVFSVLLLFGITAVFLFVMEDRLIMDEAKENLTALTKRAVSDVSFVDGKMRVDENLVYSLGGSCIVICGENGQVLRGEIPEGFENTQGREEEKIRYVRFGRNAFYIYDKGLPESPGNAYWVRGIASVNLKEISPTLYSVSHLFLASVPFLVLAAILGGLYVTHRAFVPLGRLVNTAASIHEGTDLSRRIGMGAPDSDDELLRTAGVFDQMLSRIQTSFERERQFTDSASHELRTPVAVIMSQSEYALQHRDDPETMREALEKIYGQSRKMSEMISKLLFLARADSGRQQIHREKLDISLCAEESASLLAESARHRQISLLVEAEEGIYILGDEMLIGQMLTNLIANGIKYGKEGGWVRVRIISDRMNVIIRVDDNGQGMDEDELSHIWERFYRGSPGGKVHARQDEGRMPSARYDDSTGLGLTITKWIAEAHGGTIRVVSRPGKGTSFRVLLSAY